MDKKIKFSLGLLILIIIALSAELIYYQKITKKTSVPEVPLKEETSVPKKLTNLEIAKKVLDCLEGMRDDEGIYFYSKECSSSKTCQSKVRDSRVGINVLLGETEYIKRTKDQTQFEILKNDINNYLDNKKISFISPDFWSKNIFFQMKDSHIFSEREEEMIGGINKKTKHAHTKGSLEILKKINSQNYIELNPSLIDFKNSSFKKNNDISREDWRNEIVLSSDFLYSFLAEKKQEDLRMAKELLVKVTSEYPFLEKNLPLGEKCLLGTVSSKFSNYLKDKGLLENSENLFNELEIEESCWFSDLCPVDLFEPIACGLFSDQLYLSTQKKEYLFLRDKILSHLIANNFDYAGYQGSYVGDGCFYNRNTDPDRRIRPTLENGLLVEMLSW